VAFPIDIDRMIIRRFIFPGEERSMPSILAEIGF
jgi:hypothetical protein